jgi:hypothetical protein
MPPHTVAYKIPTIQICELFIMIVTRPLTSILGHHNNNYLGNIETHKNRVFRPADECDPVKILKGKIGRSLYSPGLALFRFGLKQSRVPIRCNHGTANRVRRQFLQHDVEHIHSTLVVAFRINGLCH